MARSSCSASPPPLAPAAPLASLPPEAAVAALGGRAGDRQRRALVCCASSRPDATEALPDAADGACCPTALAALPPRPIYGRAPDAKLPGAGA